MRIFLKFFIFSITFLCIIFFSLYFFFNNDWLYTRLLPQVAQTYLKDGQIKTLTYGSHVFRFPCCFLFKDIQIVIQKKDALEKFSIEALYVEDIFKSLRPTHEIKAHIKNLSGEFPPCRINNLNLNAWLTFNPQKNLKIDGNLEIDEVNFYNLKAVHILSCLRDQSNKIDFFNVFANFYNGQIQGEIFLDYLSGMSYSIQMGLKNIDLRKMQTAYPDIFSQIDGKLNSRVQATGKMDKINSFQADLNTPSGGKLKAALLGFIAGYLPQSTQKKDLELLIAAGGDVPFEDGLLSIQSVSDDKLATAVVLKSQKFNLDINVGVDVNLEGGFQNLFKYLGEISKK